ncbi:MAG: TolC family protein [Bacteroidota bacterium]
MKQYLFLITVCILGTSAGRIHGQFADSLHLAELQDMARQQALGVALAERDFILAENDVDQYRASLSPQLSLNANFPNYARSAQETTQPDGSIAFQPVRINNSFVGVDFQQRIGPTGGLLFASTNLQRFDNFESDFRQYRGLPIRVGLQQPILAFNPWKWDKRILPVAAEAARLRRTAETEAAALSATSLFFNLLTADQNRQLAEFNENVNQQLLEVARERFELGSISRNDLVQIELELVSAQQARQSARLELDQASAAIYRFLGLAYAGIPIQPVQPEAPALPNMEATELANLARRLRPEWLEAQVNILSAERAIDQARRDNGPRLDLLASFGLVRSDENLSEVYADPQREEIIQLQLSLPIIDGGTRRTAIREAEALADYTKQEATFTQNQLLGDLQISLTELERTARTLELAEDISRLAEERFSISQESYLLGAMPLTDLNLAQRSRDQSRRAYISQLRDYCVAFNRLSLLTGFDFINNIPHSEL